MRRRRALCVIPTDSNVFTKELTANVKLKWKIVLRCSVPVFYFFDCLVCMQALLAFWIKLPAVLTHNNRPVWHHHWSPLWEHWGFHPMLQTRLVISGTNFRWFTCMSFILCFPDASSQITFSVQCFIWLFIVRWLVFAQGGGIRVIPVGTYRSQTLGRQTNKNTQLLKQAFVYLPVYTWKSIFLHECFWTYSGVCVFFSPAWRGRFRIRRCRRGSCTRVLSWC